MRLRILRVFLIAVLGFSALPATTSANPITLGLAVDVYVLCDDAGLNCASTGPASDSYFATEVNKIWNQAGIGVVFNFVQNISSTAFSFLDDGVAGDGFSDLTAAYGAPGMSSTTLVDLFLVRDIVGAYGEGWIGAGGAAIAMDPVMAFNGGLGRIDTIAHELGHNLGLVPNSLGGINGHSTVPSELMASGGLRSIPTTLADIYPDGLQLDQIPTAQIALARDSSLLDPVPEPSTLVLMISGVAGLVLAKRRRKA